MNGMSTGQSKKKPLIKELQELWKAFGRKTQLWGTHFQNENWRVLWTINDFPARSSLSGWSGQGYYACPTCNVDTHRDVLQEQNPIKLVIEEFKDTTSTKE
ncbi:hypothetical protein Tco_0677087 [Tanacetum coccineum]